MAGGPPEGFVRVGLLSYAGWDVKPREIDQSGDVIAVYSLITPSELQEALTRGHSPGELELLDAINLMERGDYAGAVRRVTLQSRPHLKEYCALSLSLVTVSRKRRLG